MSTVRRGLVKGERISSMTFVDEILEKQKSLSPEAFTALRTMLILVSEEAYRRGYDDCLADWVTPSKVKK